MDNQQVVDLVISRTELVEYCRDELGLKVGNKLKQGLDVPSWIRCKRGYIGACLRGMVDTDGSIFWERHKIKKKIYSYPRLSFVSASRPLRESVFLILRSFGFTPRMRKKDGVYRCVQLESMEEIRHYFETVGTHNPKHERRFLVR